MTVKPSIVRPMLLAAIALGASASAQERAQLERTDARKLGRLNQTWMIALREAQAADPRGVRSLGALVRPGGALDRVHPTPGNYRCRTVKLGTQGITNAFTLYPWFRCTVELTPGGDLRLAKVDGSQRQAGKLYPRGRRQLVFAGSLSLGNERGWKDYGVDPERNVIGLFERIGPRRYRLLMPEPQWESKLDILELVVSN